MAEAADTAVTTAPAIPQTDRFVDAVRYRAGGSAPIAGTTADLNADGINDLMLVLVDGSGISVLLSNPADGHATATKYKTGTEPRSVAAADLDNDGDLDLVVGHMSAGIAVLHGDGRGSFGAATSIDSRTLGDGANNPEYLSLADVDADGLPDIVALDVERNLLVLHNDAGRFATAQRTSLPRLRYDGLAVGDLNGDRFPDVAAVASPTGRLVVAFNDGTGAFAKPIPVMTGTEEPPPPPRIKCSGDVCSKDAGLMGRAQVVIGDVDADRRPDLVIAHALTPGLTVLGGDGMGGFAAPRRVGEDLRGAAAAAVADVDGDGIVDLLALDGEDGLALLQGLGGGQFAAPEQYATARHGSADNAVAGQALMIGRMDADNSIDVAVVDVFTNEVVVHRNATALQ